MISGDKQNAKTRLRGRMPSSDRSSLRSSRHRFHSKSFESLSFRFGFNGFGDRFNTVEGTHKMARHSFGMKTVSV